MTQLGDYVGSTAEDLGVPGVGVGILCDGRQEYASHGVTNIENPLSVTSETMFQIGSITKTYTATAVAVLAERRLLDLDAPVRLYVPELRLADESTAARVTVRQLLTHTAGWEGDVERDTGEGDDALQAYVSGMTELPQIAPLGARASYSNSAFNLAGRVIERVTGTPYETAIDELLLTPAGLESSYFRADEVMTHRFAAGHEIGDDGVPSVVRPWRSPRNINAAGGLTSTVPDQLRWAQIHLESGAGVLPAKAIESMREPNVTLRGSALGDAIGLSWFLRDVGGTRLVGHGGTTTGQYSELLMVPARGFAVVSVTNCGPNGLQFNRRLLRWVLETYLGIVEPPLETEHLSERELQPFAGTYETGATSLTIRVDDAGLTAEFELKPETRAEIGDSAPVYPPFSLEMLRDRTGEYVIDGGPADGVRGYFDLDDRGHAVAVDFSGRLHVRR